MPQHFAPAKDGVLHIDFYFHLSVAAVFSLTL